METAENSAVLGTPMPTRMVPWLSSMLKETLRWSSVDVWAKKPLGALDPSLMRNSGWRPSVLVKVERIFESEMPSPLSSLFQLLHVRPLIPSFWKNGFAVSMLPAVECTSRVPTPLLNDAGVVRLYAASSVAVSPTAAEQPTPPTNPTAKMRP